MNFDTLKGTVWRHAFTPHHAVFYCNLAIFPIMQQPHETLSQVITRIIDSVVLPARGFPAYASTGMESLRELLRYAALTRPRGRLVNNTRNLSAYQRRPSHANDHHGAWHHTFRANIRIPIGAIGAHLIAAYLCQACFIFGVRAHIFQVSAQAWPQSSSTAAQDHIVYIGIIISLVAIGSIERLCSIHHTRSLMCHPISGHRGHRRGLCRRHHHLQVQLDTSFGLLQPCQVTTSTFAPVPSLRPNTLALFGHASSI
eukprot:scaffold90709_cov28-Prasinocladus_malaysianus.AAC.1